MFKIFFVVMSLGCSLFVQASELAPPPPPPLLQPPAVSSPTQPPKPTAPPARQESGGPSASRVLFKCEVDQFVLNCQDNSFCAVGPEITPRPVRVVLQQKKNGQIELVTNLNGDERLVFTSQQAMKCDLPAYFCQSQNGQESLQVLQVMSTEYGTQDFTVQINDPLPWTSFSVGATAQIRCWTVRN